MRTIRLLMAALMMGVPTLMTAQMDASIRLNEVQTDNQSGLIDEYGNHRAWIEIANTSHSTYNIRGMYLTTDRSVLDKTLSVPERVKRMSPIPSGDERTNLSGRQHLLLYCNSNPAQGTLHLSVPIEPGKPVWVALYNGNATQLIDSVTVPALQTDQSYARIKDGAARWDIKPSEAVTPGINNYISASETKIEKFKREDPHGIAMAIMAMGIVFFCLALLWLFFTLFGLIMRHQETVKKVAAHQPVKPVVKTVEKTAEISHKTGVLLQDGLKTKGIDKEIYIAVIAMALKQYQDNVHDIESGIITIKPKETGWDDEYVQMTHFHEPVLPTTHTGPQIPTELKR